MKIWKFVLALSDTQVVPMPKGSTILTIQVQKGNLCLWALCDENADEGGPGRRINIYGTGNPLPENGHIGEYISTFQLYGGDLVFHAFEVPL